MTALDFLSLLVSEYRDHGLHVSAALINFPLLHLKEGRVEDALKSIAEGKDFIVGKMNKGHYEVERYSRDLCVLDVLETMISKENPHG